MNINNKKARTLTTHPYVGTAYFHLEYSALDGLKFLIEYHYLKREESTGH